MEVLRRSPFFEKGGGGGGAPPHGPSALCPAQHSFFNNVHLNHAEVDAPQRTAFIESLRKDPNGVLVTTGAFSQSLRLRNIACVINYDLPTEIAEYRRRLALPLGRQRGVVHSLFNAAADEGLAVHLILELKKVKALPPKELFMVVANTV